MGLPPEDLLNRVVKAGFQMSQIKALIVCNGFMIIVAIAGTLFSLPASAVNCTTCGHEMDSDRICHNHLCPESAIHCSPPVTVPEWLLNLSRTVRRDENNRPNIERNMSQHAYYNPQIAFNNADIAINTLQACLTTRGQHFIVNYYFPSEEIMYPFHLAVAVNDHGTIFAMSNVPGLWNDITQVSISEILTILSLKNGNFDPGTERMTMSHVALPAVLPKAPMIPVMPVIYEAEE